MGIRVMRLLLSAGPLLLLGLQETEAVLLRAPKGTEACRNWCYNEEQADKPWEGKKCNWKRCYGCDECTCSTFNIVVCESHMCSKCDSDWCRKSCEEMSLKHPGCTCPDNISGEILSDK
mmetsp:Transcript_8369/g.18295  ORF Transcript_8369/g.18295 Transcript_8369/m.18295 type:complete len:119 (+) Transcript_8369:53-409(+)